MTKAAEKIEEQMLKLPADDLVALHSRLMEAIYDKTEQGGLDPSYRDEIKKRRRG